MHARTRRCGAILCILAAGCITPSQPFNQRGVALFNAERYDAARAEFLQATVADPLNADAFYNLASAHHRLGEPAEAEWNYNRCLTVNPDHSKCHHAVAVLLLEQGRTEQARASVRRWANNSPGRPDPLVELAWLEKQSGRTEEASGLLRQAIELQPRHPRALAELASLYEGSDDPGRALALYERALASDPQQAELSRKVADLRGSAPNRFPQYTPPARSPGETPPRVARDLRYDFR